MKKKNINYKIKTEKKVWVETTPNITIVQKKKKNCNTKWMKKKKIGNNNNIVWQTIGDSLHYIFEFKLYAYDVFGVVAILIE